MATPNILILMGDEHPAFLAGCYGHRTVKTPTIDALSSRGATFDAAYCPSPICCPSRAAMMTSCFPHRLGVWDNAAPLNCDWPTFSHNFRAAGYRTILCGKMHFVGPDQHHGFEERWTQDIYPADFRWTRPHYPEPPINDGQNIDRVMEAGARWTTDMDYDEEVAFRAEYGLRMLGRDAENENRPWMLCVSFTGPHYPFAAPQKYLDLYKNADIALPEIPSDYESREHTYVKWLRRHGKFHELVPDDICRLARQTILARTTMLDDHLARVMAALGTMESADNTIVVYLSDHGEMLGEHGLWFKNCAYDWSARVPMIVAGPGIERRRIAQPVSGLDLGPTLCGLAGIKMLYDKIDGVDQSRLVMGAQGGEGRVIMENYGEGVHRGVRTIRRGKFKLNYVHTLEPELFDLQNDPNEWNNLAGEKEYAAVRDDLLQDVLRDWNPQACDEERWESERRRLAILKAVDMNSLDWQYASPPIPRVYKF